MNGVWPSAPSLRARRRRRAASHGSRSAKMENPKLWGPGGLCLNIQEDAGLETALLDGALKNNLPKLEFWGKITGTTGDYLIAVGYSRNTRFPRRPSSGRLLLRLMSSK